MPLGNAYQGELFFTQISATYMKYTKPSLPITQQIQHLKGKGLIFKDEARAARYLNTISYYRLSGYFLPFKQKRLYKLLQECPLDIHANMGFPQDWEKNKFWKI